MLDSRINVATANPIARPRCIALLLFTGLRQTLVTAGMLIGSSVASLTFAATGQNYILTFATATVFPVLALWWMVQVSGQVSYCESQLAAAATA